MMDISDERLGDIWRMPDHYMRPISFARAVLALQKRADVVPLSEEQIAELREEQPIYQWQKTQDGPWTDVSHEDWKSVGTLYRRVVYLAPAATCAQVLPSAEKWCAMHGWRTRDWMEGWDAARAALSGETK